MLIENEFKKIQTFDSVFLLVEVIFNIDGVQLYLQNYIRFSAHPDTISKWESKGLSNEKFWPPFTTSKSSSPKLVWYNSRIKLKFKGSSLKQEDKAALTPTNVVNFFIVYGLDSWPLDLGIDFTLRGCLFGGVKLAKNADPYKYVCSGYCIGFSTYIDYSLPDSSIDKNVIIFGADTSSSVHFDNKGKDMLILGKGPTQGLNNTPLTAEAQIFN